MSTEPWSHLLTHARVVELHRQGIERYGGDPSHRSETAVCVREKLGNAWTSETYMAGEQSSVSGLCFAGYLLFYLVTSHCFVDGNKRVRYLCATDVLARLSLTITASQREVVEFVERIAKGGAAMGGNALSGCRTGSTLRMI